MKKLTYGEFKEAMWKFNTDKEKSEYKDREKLYGVVVITADTFNRSYSEKERSYKTSNDQKAFLPNMISNSIFADCLDGKDLGVRLDWYINGQVDGWKVDYCYMVED